MFSFVILPIGSCPECSRKDQGSNGRAGALMGWALPQWAFKGQALVAPPGDLRSWPLCARGPGPCGPPCALMRQALVGPPGPYGPGPSRPSWALMGRALVGPGPGIAATGFKLTPRLGTQR